MPTEIESQVRAELRREAGRVQAGDLRPLTVPPASPWPAWRALLPAAGRRSVVRWLAPAAAMVAVIAVIAAVMTAGAGVRPSAAGPAAGGAAGLPRFYVSLTFQPKVRAVVHDSRTGEVTGSYRLPPAYQGPRAAPAIAAARNDREFAIAATERRGHSETDLRILDLRLTSDGRVASMAALGRLTAPGSAEFVDGIALSPDGRQLAAAIQVLTTTGFRPRAQIKVISMRTGATRTWTAAGKTQLPLDPSWQAGGRYLGFLLWDHIRGPGASSFTARAQLRRLDTAAPSRDLMSARVLATSADARGFLEDAFLSPDGRSALVASYRNVAASRPGHGTAILRVQAVGVSGGRVNQVLCRKSVRYQNAEQRNAADSSFRVLSVAGQGQHALVMCPSLARLDNGSLTALPGLGQLPIVAW